MLHVLNDATLKAEVEYRYFNYKIVDIMWGKLNFKFHMVPKASKAKAVPNLERVLKLNKTLETTRISYFKRS